MSKSNLAQAKSAWHSHTSPKQDELMARCRLGGYGLAEGARLSTKSVGALNCVAQHAWECPKGNICIITVSQTVGLDSGIWPDLVNTILPQWIDGDFGMEWVKEPYQENTTKKPTCKVLNMHGRPCKIQLESLKDEREVEKNWKPRRYSMIYVPELSSFQNAKTFVTWTECLRMIGLPMEKHLFLADTNPPDEGRLSWMYRYWFELADADESDVSPNELAIKRMLWRMHFRLEDNIFDSPERIALLKAKYSSSPDLYARYVRGEWVTSTEDALFAGVFRPDFHVRGEIQTPVNTTPELLVPERNCSVLDSSMDPGATNFAAHIFEKAYERRKTISEEGNDKEVDVAIIKVLDEQIIIGEDFDLTKFIEDMVERMLKWERIVNIVNEKPTRTLWHNWADRSVFDGKIPFSDRYWHQLIWEASGGKLVLLGVERPKGSVSQRVDLFRKLIWEDRIFFSKTNCPQTIEMVQSIKRSKSQHSVIAPGDRFKHIFDSLTYGIVSELYDEVRRNVAMNMRKSKQGELISVPL